MLKVSPKTTVLSTLLWEPRSWLPETNSQPTSTSGKMKLCISKKEPFTFIWETRNAICTQEEPVFIPAYTWVSVKNAGTETASVVFVFSAPGFENYMRCDSVLANEKVTPLSLEEQTGCAHEGHVIYQDLEENSKK